MQEGLAILITSLVIVVVRGNNGYNFNQGPYGYRASNPHHPRPIYFRGCTPRYLAPVAAAVSNTRPTGNKHQGWSSLTKEEKTASPNYPVNPPISSDRSSYSIPCNPTYDKNCNNVNERPTVLTSNPEYVTPIYYEEDFNKKTDQDHAHGQSSEAYPKIEDGAAEVYKTKESTTTPIPITAATTVAIPTQTPSPTTTPTITSTIGHQGLENHNPPSGPAAGGYPSSPLEESGAANDKGQPQPEIFSTDGADPNYYPRFEENENNNSNANEQGFDPSPATPSSADLSHSKEPGPVIGIERSEHDLSESEQGHGQLPQYNAPGIGPSASYANPTPEESLPSPEKNDDNQDTFPSSGGDGWSSFSSKKNQNDYDTKFANQVLEAHNYYRTLHRAPPLALDEELSKVAQELATSFASGSPFVHSPNSVLGDYGESIAIHGGGTVTGSDATTSWYKEHVNYDFSDPKLTSPIAKRNSNTDFTALVWSGSRQLGVGKARGGDGRTFVVATYFPPGNNPSQLRTNVFAPLNLSRNNRGGHGQRQY